MYSDDQAVGKARRYTNLVMQRSVPPAGYPLRVTWKPLTDRCSVGVFRAAARGYIKLSPPKTKKNKVNTPLVRIPCPVSIRSACTLPSARSYVNLAPPIQFAGTSRIEATWPSGPSHSSLVRISKYYQTASPGETSRASGRELTLL